MVDTSQLSGSLGISSNAPRVSTAGTLAALNAVVSRAVDGMSTAVIQATGTWAGTISWFGSIDGGTTYFPINATPFGAGLSGASVASATANGQWEIAVGALTHIEAQMTAYTSGSASIVLAAANGAKITRVKAPTTDPLPVQWSSQTITLGAGSATFGAISNTSFGISGTLPAFAATPTFNIGTLNGAALDTSVQAVKTALGSPFQVGGSIGNTVFGATQSGTWTVSLASTPGSVTTAAPTYATGTTQPLSLNTAGGLRVDGSGVTQPVSLATSSQIFTGQYTTSPLSLTANQVYFPALDNTRHLSTSPTGSADPLVGMVPYATTAAGSSLQLKASAGNAYSGSVTASATAGFLLLLDAATVPSSGAAVTPKFCMAVAANVSWAGAFTGINIPKALANGGFLVFSSAIFTYTPVSAAFISGEMR